MPADQVLPPSVVRPNVPRVPPTQATFGLTTHRPRKSASVPLACGCHWPQALAAAAPAAFGTHADRAAEMAVGAVALWLPLAAGVACAEAEKVTGEDRLFQGGLALRLHGFFFAGASQMSCSRAWISGSASRS